MKIAIPTENNNVAQHFGRCQQYTLVDVENSKVTNIVVIDNPGHAPGAIPKFLNEKGCNLIITGGMGQKAQQFFEQFNISWIIGVQGDVKSVINDFINNNLIVGDSTCDHGEGKGTGYRDCH
ncbi:MAG: NifB/NifX family molybdenum-iron cluster-binding protein [Candidatus Cloacimonadota bacterium]|nr:NifB/NifX family molybdenum-iron cluster-binding protein [Candidatus Cloacimonadota bacterium]